MDRREFITLIGGAAATWPVAPRAQEPMPLVGGLYLGNSFGFLPAFRRGLAEAGFVEGQNVRFEFHGSVNNRDMRAIAVELVNKRPDVIVATQSAPAVRAAIAATSTVPIVFVFMDPLKYGFVTSLSRPNGNVTGIDLLSSELVGKRLNLLLELAPQAKKVAYLSGPGGAPTFEDLRSQTIAAGQALGREIVVLEIRGSLDLEPAFENLVEQGAGAAMVGDFFNLARASDQIIALAARHMVPTSYPRRFYCVEGGLMSYNADDVDAYRKLGAQYVGRILKGAKPSDLPVQQPTKFKLVINLKTAKTLGLTVPPTILATADEVIE